ncbi:MAG: helix-hairpin-helix domain-containing protein [Bacteroidota bacterium]
MPRLLPRFSRPTCTTRAFWTDRAAWTTRVYDLQHRLAVTTTEATALLTLAGLLVLGLGVRAWQAQQIPFDDAFYAETDATFAGLSEAREGAPVAPRPSAASIATRLHAAAADTVRDASKTSGAGPSEAPPVAESTPTPRPRSTRAAAGPVRMNVNTASARLLDRLPGIGPALAERIIAYRAEHGDFRRAEDLVNVRGIGPKTFDRMAPYVFVEDGTVAVSADRN